MRSRNNSGKPTLLSAIVSSNIWAKHEFPMSTKEWRFLQPIASTTLGLSQLRFSDEEEQILVLPQAINELHAAPGRSG